MYVSESAIRLLVLSAFLLAHVVLSLRRVICSGPRPSFAAFWQLLARWGHAVRAWKQRLAADHHEAGAAEEDATARAMATLVADAVQQRKEVVRRAFACNLLHAVSVLTVLLIIYTLRSGGSGLGRPLFVSTCLWYSVLFLSQHCPGCCSMNTSRLLVATAVLILNLLRIRYPPKHAWVMIMLRFAVTMPARVVGSIIVLDTPMVCAVNAASSIPFIIMIYRSEGLDEWPGMRAYTCLAEGFCTVFICACARFFEDHVVASCRHAIELKASKSEAYATAKVLNAVCDAVVHLDEHLRVATADASLAALLLHGRGCTQAGSDFLQYLYNRADYQAFRDWLKASPTRCEAHVAFQTRLRDSSGSAIAVEMFNVAFETITGAACYFIGIREKALAGSAPPHGDQGRLNEDGVAAPREFAGSPLSRRSPRWSSMSSDGSSSSDGLPSLFQFDALTMEILGYSPGFSAFGRFDRPPEGSKLLDAIPACDVNVEFLRSFDFWAAALEERSRDRPDPVEVKFDSAIAFRLGPNNDCFRVDVSVKLSSRTEPAAGPGGQHQPPRAVGTVRVLSVIQDQDCPASPAASSRPELLSL